MKRLLSMILSLFISMFNNVDYQMHDAMPFEHDAYYTIAEAEAPDYRMSFGDVTTAGRQRSCVSQLFTLNGHLIQYPTSMKGIIGGYWFVNSSSMKYDELSGNSYTFETDGKIICPYDGILKTSSVTSDGRSMDILFSLGDSIHDGYVMRITNMERWWCCDSKVDYDSTDQLGRGTWVHTCSELKGATLKQGVYLGRATAGNTTITIYDDSGNKVDFKTFYSH